MAISKADTSTLLDYNMTNNNMTLATGGNDNTHSNIDLGRDSVNMHADLYTKKPTTSTSPISP